jgi:uncharacterized protein with GYD domain
MELITEKSTPTEIQELRDRNRRENEARQAARLEELTTRVSNGEIVTGPVDVVVIDASSGEEPVAVSVH